MPDQPERTSEEPAGARVEIARLAGWAAAGTPGVRAVLAGTHGGEDGEPVVMPERDGGYSVHLYLRTALDRIPDVCERVRDRVAAAAERAGLGGELRAIDVTVVDVEAGDERGRG